ncbi:MAG: cytochrome P450 [Proteobacteria bacterium]|nr:cytochrome P450 [Pseudomonadota bacterium]
MNGQAVVSQELTGARLRPAAPIPRNRVLSTFEIILELGKNPIATFGAPSYRLPYIPYPSRIRRFLMVNDPEGVKRVLLDNAGNYIKADQVQRQLRPALGNGLVTAEGADWRVQRRAIAPMFQMRHIASFAPAMSQATQEMLARWRELPHGEIIDADDEMMRLTYDIISRTVFSNDVTMDYRAMARAIAVYFENVGRVDFLAALGVPDWVPTPRRLRAWPALRFFRREMEGLIGRRRALLERDPDKAPNDLLTLLLTARDPETGTRFGEDEIFDNVMTFIFAGHETTANVLAWTLYLLSQFPDVDVRLAKESQTVLQGKVAGAEDISSLVYTRMVLEESMRLYPPAPLLAREAVGRDVIGGHAIEPRTVLLVSPWVIHRHRLLWDEAEYFDPERFAPGKREKIHRFAYIPFGAGPRICIGMGFAMQEAVICLATMIQHWRFELVPGHPVMPLARITLRPQYGLKMRLHCRD